MSAPATDDVRAEREGLVARLRAVNCCAYAIIFDDAADLIETQAAEIERLTRQISDMTKDQSEIVTRFLAVKDRFPNWRGIVSWPADGVALVDHATNQEARAERAEAEVARLREALREAARTMETCRSAVSSGQLVDKDVHGSLARGVEKALSDGRDAALQPRTPSHG